MAYGILGSVFRSGENRMKDNFYLLYKCTVVYCCSELSFVDHLDVKSLP